MIQPLSNPLHGRRLHEFHYAAVPAGGEILIEIPENVAWEILAFQATLTTAVGGPDRIINLGIMPTAITFQLGIVETPLPAAGVRAINWIAGNTLSLNFAAIFTDYVHFPQGVILPHPSALITRTVNIQALDQWSASDLMVYETIIG